MSPGMALGTKGRTVGRGWKDRMAGDAVNILKRKDERTRKPPASGSRFKVERALACGDLTQGQY